MSAAARVGAQAGATGAPAAGAALADGAVASAIEPLDVDVAVVGAGPAGLAAAVAARQAGAGAVLLMEREAFAGGVLPQCVHDGFGLRAQGRSLTGPEYAQLWQGKAQAAGVRLALGTTVLAINRAGDAGAPGRCEQEGKGALGHGAGRASADAVSLGVAEGPFPFLLDAVGAPLGGRRLVRARAVVVATGCRERTRGQLGIPGTRPAGVMTAGTAQYMMNVANQLPGDKAVVLGSGDIGLIMARRLVLEGAEVRLVLGQQAAGLLRNRLRCIDDFGIDLRYGWGVAQVHGVGRLKGVTVAPMAPGGGFDLSQRQYVRCNLLLLACGLVPEREVLAGLEGAGGGAGVGAGAGVDALAAEGLFVCGNAERPHDLVDDVTDEAIEAGRAAAVVAAERAGRVAGAAGVGGQVAVAAGGGSAAAGPGRWRPAAKDDGRVLEKGRLVACTVCPSGCVMQVDASGTVSGQGCARGQAYAHDELACPKRLFTGTVRVAGAPASGPGSLLAVRTAAEVPLARMMDVARAARQVRARGPLQVGSVVRANVAGTGVDLVASAPLPAPDAAASGGPSPTQGARP